MKPKIIDLSIQKPGPKKEEPPMTLVVLALAPFGCLFGWFLLQAFIHGIY